MTSHFNDVKLFVQMKIYCHFYGKILLNVRYGSFANTGKELSANEC